MLSGGHGGGSMGASSSRGTAELMHYDEAHFWAALRETIERQGEGAERRKTGTGRMGARDEETQTGSRLGRPGTRLL